MLYMNETSSSFIINGVVKKMGNQLIVLSPNSKHPFRLISSFSHCQKSIWQITQQIIESYIVFCKRPCKKQIRYILTYLYFSIDQKRVFLFNFPIEILESRNKPFKLDVLGSMCSFLQSSSARSAWSKHIHIPLCRTMTEQADTASC